MAKLKEILLLGFNFKRILKKKIKYCAFHLVYTLCPWHFLLAFSNKASCQVIYCPVESPMWQELRTASG